MNSSREEIRQHRLRKLEAFEAAGFLAYPQSCKRTHTLAAVRSEFEQLADSAKEVTLVGRLRAIRGHGGSTFLQLEDGTDSFQAYFKKDRVGEETYSLFISTIDVGDFIQLRGTLFTTQKGEKTLEVADIKMLTKSLLPLPEKWHGLQDAEERYRKRYLDLMFNDEVRNTFVARAKLLKSIRGFLEKEGFIEVDTPILQTIYGGADANPFETHLNAFDLDVYLRIAPELYLKRLIVGGLEKVYEIGRVFRNEGVDRSHNPDFTMLEFYWAYADYKQMMQLTEELFSHMLKEVFGTMRIKYKDKEIDFTPPWGRVEYTELLKKYADIDLEAINKERLLEKTKELKVKVDPSLSKAKIADAIYKKYCLGQLEQPTFLIHHPAGSIALAKRLDKDPAKLGTFQLVVAGWEIVKAYSELNNPLRQRDVFKEQEKMFEAGDEEAQRLDTDFVEALEYGMPPTAGFGMGIDRLTALLTNSHSLREVILFPMMKPKNDARH